MGEKEKSGGEKPLPLTEDPKMAPSPSPEKPKNEKEIFANKLGAELYPVCKSKALDWSQWLASKEGKGGKREYSFFINDFPKLGITNPDTAAELEKIKTDLASDSAEVRENAEGRLAALVRLLNLMDKQLQTTREEKEKLGRSAIVDTVTGMGKNLEKAWSGLSDGGRIAAGAMVLFVLWRVKNWFTNYKSGNAAFVVGGGILAYLGAGEIARAATKGKNSLGVDTLYGGIDRLITGGGKIGKRFGYEDEDVNFTETCDKAGIESGFIKEWAAIADLPLPDVIRVYEEEKSQPVAPGKKHKIDIRKLGLTKGGQRRSVNGENMFNMLEKICDPADPYFGYLGGIDNIKRMWVENKTEPIPFGTFLMTANENMHIRREFGDVIAAFRRAASGLVADAVVNSLVIGAHLAKNAIWFPLEVFGKTTTGTFKRIFYRTDKAVWEYDGKSYSTAEEALQVAYA